jgi:hypothetical protein
MRLAGLGALDLNVGVGERAVGGHGVCSGNGECAAGDAREELATLHRITS